MNVQLRLSAEDHRRRQALVKTLLEFVRHMPMEGWTQEDAQVCWAIRLADYEGRPADMPFLTEKTGLSRATIQRRLEAQRRARNIAVHWTGRRKHYAHTPQADSQVSEKQYYEALQLILTQWCEEASQNSPRS